MSISQCEAFNDLYCMLYYIHTAKVVLQYFLWLLDI